MERFFIKNFGCRASQADGAAIEAGLAAKGFTASAEAAGADLVVLNTCTVTSTADDERGRPFAAFTARARTRAFW